MIIHNIPIEAFIPNGKISVSGTDISADDSGACVEIPGKFKLPFRIDMTAKIDSPALILHIGKGYINLNTGGMDNRRMMSVIGGETKPNIHKFDNSVPLNEYFNVSVIYGRKSMQLIINGEERYLTRKDIYMKSPLIDTDFKDGFGLKISCHKLTEVYIKSLAVTEYSDEPQISVLPKRDYVYSPCLTAAYKPTLDECINDLTPELKDCIYDIEKYLKDLKFSRKIEGGYPESKITYILSKAVSYQIKISRNLLTHRIAAVMGNYTDNFDMKLLNKLEDINPDFAEKIFYRMQHGHCAYCNKCSKCRPIEFRENTKNNCQHIVQFKMIPYDFSDVKRFIDILLA